MTPDPSTEALMAEWKQVKVAALDGYTMIGVEQYDDLLLVGDALAARLSQAEEALRKIESLPRRLHPIAGYMFDTDPCRIAERALAASSKDPKGSSAGETPDAT